MEYRVLINKILRRLREIFSHKYLVGKISSGYSYYVNFNNFAKYTIVEELKFDFVSQVCYIGDEEREEIKVQLREKYLLEIDDCYVIGGSNAIYTNGYIIHDNVVFAEKSERITDRGLFRIYNGAVHLGNRYVINYLQRGQEIDSAINLCGNYSSNLYHFVYEILSKFYILSKVEIAQDVPILLDYSAKHIPQFAELVELFSNHRSIIYANPEELVYINHCYHLSQCHTIPMNYKDMKLCSSADVKFDRVVLRFLRDHILSLATMDVEFPKRFFISRKSTKWRSYNEDEVIEVVNDFGFTVVYPEEMTYQQQVSMFHNAEYIIAASGAALTNIISCRPGCRVLTLISTRIDLSIFSTIAAAFGIDLKYMNGVITNEQNVQSDFRIDCVKLKEYLGNE